MRDEPVGSGQEDGPSPQPHIAMACEALNRADQAGYCIIEMPVCQNCNQKFSWMHCFEETVVCPCCSHRQASCVPRIRRAGEVGVEELQLAVAAVRRGLPRVDDAMMAWCEAQPPALKAAMVVYAARMAREALDAVTAAAEQIAQQVQPGARVGDPITGPYMFQEGKPERPLQAVLAEWGSLLPSVHLRFKRKRRA